jgi:hypothetical protein
MEYKILPFTAQLRQQDTTASVASQMQQMIDYGVSEGWEYMHMDSVQTIIAGSSGCFGFGATPSVSTTCNVLVFRKM